MNEFYQSEYQNVNHKRIGKILLLSRLCLAIFPVKSFVRSGHTHLSEGYLRILGSQGRYWAAVSGDSASAYYLDFTPSYIYPTYLDTRYYGFSARCLASGAKLEPTEALFALCAAGEFV